MARKECFRCGAVKSLSEFYRHPQMADGHINKCKDCTKADVRENYRKRVDYYRWYDKRRNRLDPKRIEWVERRERPKRAGKGKSSAEYRRNNPEIYAAHMAVSRAVSRGDLVRGACECCGATDDIHGHHDDYSKPLDVRWLCGTCHRKEHASDLEPEPPTKKASRWDKKRSPKRRKGK